MGNVDKTEKSEKKRYVKKGGNGGKRPGAGMPLGTKTYKTLLRHERRAMFDEEVSKIWMATIKSLKPEYVADQFMGKATDKIEIDAKVENNIEDLAAIAAEAAEILRKKKLNGTSNT